MLSDEQTREAEGLVRRLLELIGDDPNSPHLKETPARVVRSWRELYSGYAGSAEGLGKLFPVTFDDLVVVRGISYFSTCEHHMLPFHGELSIAYLPGKQVLGLSKFARVVELFSRRLQTQERMTRQIADAIVELTEPRGVAVLVDGTHLCMLARGVKQASATMRTSCMLGDIRRDMGLRTEVLRLLGGMQ